MAKPPLSFYPSNGLGKIKALIFILFLLIILSYGVYSVYLKVHAQPFYSSPPISYSYINNIDPRRAYIGGSRLGLYNDNVVGVTATITVGRADSYVLIVTYSNGVTTVTTSTTTYLSPGTRTLTLQIEPTPYLRNPSLKLEIYEALTILQNSSSIISGLEEWGEEFEAE